MEQNNKIVKYISEFLHNNLEEFVVVDSKLRDKLKKSLEIYLVLWQRWHLPEGGVDVGQHEAQRVARLAVGQVGRTEQDVDAVVSTPAVFDAVDHATPHPVQAG